MDATTDFEWDDNLSYDENVSNCEARISHLRDWGNKWWGKELNAITCCAVAEVLEMRLEAAYEGDDEPNCYVGEDDWKDPVEDMMNEQMADILDEWVEYNSIDKAVMNHGYQWMLWSVGYQTSGVYDIVNEWLDNNEYEHKDKIYQLMEE